MSETQYPVPRNLASPRRQKVNHPWNRGYRNHREVLEVFDESGQLQQVGGGAPPPYLETEESEVAA